MTDPGASPGHQQSAAAEPPLPGPAGDPEAQGTAGTPSGPAADTPPPPTAGEKRPRGFVIPDDEIPDDELSVLELVPASEAGYGLMDYLAGVADDLAQAQAALLANIVPKVRFADFALASVAPEVSLARSAFFHAAGLEAVARLSVPPDLGLFQASLPTLSLAAGLPSAGDYAAPALEAVARLSVPPDLGFARRISEMAGSWDHGLLGIGRLAESTAALAADPYRELLHSMAGLTAARDSAIGSLYDFGSLSNLGSLYDFGSLGNFGSLYDFGSLSGTAGLAGLLRTWRETAEAGLGMLGTLARAAYWAALYARSAVVRGEKGPVASFIEEWLGMRPTPERVEAVSAALLEEGWDADAAEDPDFLLADLRKRSKRQARVLKPIWETQLNLRYVGSLDQPVLGASGTLLTIADQLPDPRTAEDLALAREYEQQRLRQVLDRLKPDELQVTSVYAERGELTWAEAAHLAGAADPVAMGERVRRKLKRLGDDHSRRLAEAGLA